MTLGISAIALFVLAGGVFAFSIIRIQRTKRPQWGLQAIGWAIWIIGFSVFIASLMT